MFSGFSEETIAFFATLRFNNNKAFFEENRGLFERAVREPLYALAEALAPTVHAIDPRLDTRPGRAISRIYRDVRFRKDKTPYRDYMWIGYRRMGESREETCGFYFDISAEAAHWGCGYYHMQQAYMQKLRSTILEHPKRVQKIIDSKAFKALYALEGEQYVRQNLPPQDMPASLQALYRKKNVYAEHRVKDMRALFSGELAEQVAEGFRVLEPFYMLLRTCMVKTTEEGA